MPIVAFTRHLRQHAPPGPVTVDGASVRAALDSVFAGRPLLRGYVVDEHGRLRKHVAVFVDGRQIADREHLSDPVGPESEIFVMQALSGG